MSFTSNRNFLGWGFCWLLAVPGISHAAAVTHTNASAPFRWQDIKYLLAFGDSYTFVQGTLGYPNYSFVGSYLPDDFAYTPDELLTDQIVQNFTGTAEGGPNWVEFLTGCGLEEGLTSPASCDIQLWDFAFAGADVSIELNFFVLTHWGEQQSTPQHHNQTIPLVNQTQEFLTYGQPVFKDTLHVKPSETLVAIWIGINDISDTADEAYDFPVFYEDIITAVFNESVAALHEAGYDNFLFINLPPLDRTPSNLVRANPLPNKTQIAWWDDSLAQHSEAFAASHPGVTTLLYDANTFLNGVLDNATAYGIANTTNFCAGYLYADVLTDWEKYNCSGPISDYFWFNSGHMTSHVHETMTPDIRNFLVESSADEV